MKQIVLIYLSSFFFLLGCSPIEKHKKINIKTLTFSINPTKSIDFDSVFLKKELIKLESKNEALIGTISKIESRNSRFYIFDYHIEYSVTCFDKKGNFCFKLKNIGKGPTEYTDILMGNLNPSNGDIELLVNRGSQLVIYDSSGIFKRRIKLPYTAVQFCSFEDIRFFYKGFIINNANIRHSSRLFSLDSSNINIKEYLQFIYKSYNIPETSVRNFSRINDKEYRFIEAYNDTVYKLTKDGIIPLFKVDFVAQKSKPEDFLFNCKKYPDKVKIARELSIPFLRHYSETDNYIFGFYNKTAKTDGKYTDYVYYFIFDKKHNKLINNSNNIFSQSLQIYMIYPDFILNNCATSLVNADDIEKAIYKSFDSPSSRARVKKIKAYFEYDSIKNYLDNPSLLLFTDR